MLHSDNSIMQQYDFAKASLLTLHPLNISDYPTAQLAIIPFVCLSAFQRAIAL